MKKTLYINLNGFAFHIEEDAYDELKAYLDKIEKSFFDKEEAKEIIEDIEARIAELFRSSYSSNNEVITLGKVREMIRTMGEPQDIADVEEPQEEERKSRQHAKTESSYSKRLYRDPENRVLGGVCAGLGAYFNIDPIIFRVIFVIAVVFYGFSVVPYVILWIVMPRAVTIKQKLEMKGPAGYEKWEQTLRDEYQEVSEKFKNSKTYKNFNKGVYKGSEQVGSFLRNVIRILGGAIGIFIMVLVIALLISLAITLTFGVTFFDFAGISTYITGLPHYFLSSSEITMGVIAVMIVVGVPLLLLFFLGFKMVFNFKTRNGLIVLLSIAIWIGGIVMLTYAIAHQSRNYREVNSFHQSQVIEEPVSKSIYIKANANKYSFDSRNQLFEFNQLDIYMIDEQIFVMGSPRIKLVNGPEFSIDVKKTSRGSNEENAIDNAHNVEYFWSQKDSVLYVDKFITLAPKTKVRDQRVNVVISIPERYNVEIDDELTWLVYDERR